MNQTQTKYARERALKLYNRKSDEISRKYQAKVLTTKEKLEALTKGDFSLNTERSPWSPWYNCVSFGDEKTDTTIRDNELKELTRNYEKVLDEIVLGDNEEAIKLLREFENA